jgi:hypothetical protein
LRSLVRSCWWSLYHLLRVQKAWRLINGLDQQDFRLSCDNNNSFNYYYMEVGVAGLSQSFFSVTLNLLFSTSAGIINSKLSCDSSEPLHL